MDISYENLKGFSCIIIGYNLFLAKQRHFSIYLYIKKMSTVAIIFKQIDNV